MTTTTTEAPSIDALRAEARVLSERIAVLRADPRVAGGAARRGRPRRRGALLVAGVLAIALGAPVTIGQLELQRDARVDLDVCRDETRALRIAIGAREAAIAEAESGTKSDGELASLVERARARACAALPCCDGALGRATAIE